MTDKDMTIQQVADLTGLTAHTLRYYEKIGMMEPIRRAKNGHRSYHLDDMEWIRLIVRLRSTGMPIAKMQRFADMMRMGDAGISQRRALLEEHEQKLILQAKELEDTLEVLRDKIAYYRAWESEEHSG
ncbi:MerR family transcriptional regulator [Fontibacillus sp. BL9]|uniref:MerR family transcriptional regulator n=1 Tax=Fontibacillus sp. BL9 TaxID=3389971 RepID=UPI003978D54E